jgi:photosystem II stability/assembly factor-like uncharacterized protein
MCLTSTGAAQWKEILAGNPANKITCVYFNEYGIGFFGLISPTGSPTSVWRSTDSGATWNQTSIDYAHTAFGYPLAEGFAFKDARTGWFASRSGIYRTTDGGLTWSFNGDAFPDDGTRSIYYQASSGSLIRVSWTKGIFRSSDDGASWVSATMPDMGAYNGIAEWKVGALLVGNATVPAPNDFLPLLRSSDHGQTWTALALKTESWQPYCNPANDYALVPVDKSADMYKSRDHGETWHLIHAFPNDLDQSTGCLAADSRGDLYAQTIYTSVYRSTDAGESWQGICGPKNNVDTRFCIFEDKLFCGDDEGNLWMLYLRASNRLTIDTARTILASDCRPVTVPLYIGHTFACGNVAVLDSVTVDGAAFSVTFGDALHSGMSSMDSLLVTYTPEEHSDTATIVLHLRVQGSPFDTVLTIYGRLGPSFDGPAKLELRAIDGSKSERMFAGDIGEIALRIKHRVVGTAGLHAVSAVLGCTSTAGWNDATPAAGWSVTKSAFGPLLRMQLVRTGTGDIEAGEELARIRVKTYLTPDTIAYVTLDTVTFNPGEVFQGCTSQSAQTDSVSIVVASECGDSMLRRFLRSGSPLAIASMYPDPVQASMRVIVSGQSVDTRYDIIDLLGRTLRSGRLVADINVSELVPGAYYLRIHDAGSSVTRPFTIDR